MVGEMYPQKLNSNDPLFFHKQSVIDSTNYLHDKARDDKDRLYSRFYFAISLTLTIFTALFLSIISAIILLNLITILLIISARKYKQQRKRFWENRNKMKKSFQDLKLEWRD